MMNDKFTPQALRLWNKVPSWAQEKLLSNVYCGKCIAVTTIIDFSGRVIEGDLVLNGLCKTCGSEVARVIDSGNMLEYTHKQGQYLAFIYYYTKLNGVPPAETDMQRYFRTSPPTVHQMILKLEEKGHISRTPRTPRSIRLLVPREQLPDLE